jgi:hypothetical protein
LEDAYINQDMNIVVPVGSVRVPHVIDYTLAKRASSVKTLRPQAGRLLRCLTRECDNLNCCGIACTKATTATTNIATQAPYICGRTNKDEDEAAANLHLIGLSLNSIMMMIGSVDHRRDELGKALYGIAIQFIGCVPKKYPITIAA